MLVSFTLTMPNNNAWNGKWSGEGNLYAVVKSFRSKAEIERAEAALEKGYFYYDFGDGWGAAVTVKEVDRGQAAKLRRNSKGFCGYNWIIDELLRWGKIYGRHPTPDEAA